jgi:hypothetical protein
LQAHSAFGRRGLNKAGTAETALVDDRLNAKTFEWSPEWRVSFERYKREVGLGVVSWDGLLLDGWAPFEGDPFSHHPSMHGCPVYPDLGGICRITCLPGLSSR